ncbi:MAG: hypothetical protein ACI4D3_13980 [Lachnospiraceae bacterium]
MQIASGSTKKELFQVLEKIDQSTVIDTVLKTGQIRIFRMQYRKMGSNEQTADFISCIAFDRKADPVKAAAMALPVVIRTQVVDTIHLMRII